MKYKENAVIMEKKLEGSYLSLSLKTENIASYAVPGQFVNIRVTDGFDPLLRRPFGIMDTDGDILKLLILIRGKGTDMLSHKQKGDEINLIGPLGNGFPLENRRENNVYIAGGIGLAPMLYLSKKLNGGTLLFGARTAELIPDLCEYKKHCDVRISTDDGSAGVKGNVLDLMEDFPDEKTRYYICGPDPMTRAICQYFQGQPDPSRIDAYLSLETYMGCGFGACKGCAVTTKNDQYKLCCTDGPVFSWNEVKW